MARPRAGAALNSNSSSSHTKKSTSTIRRGGGDNNTAVMSRSISSSSAGSHTHQQQRNNNIRSLSCRSLSLLLVLGMLAVYSLYLYYETGTATYHPGMMLDSQQRIHHQSTEQHAAAAAAAAVVVTPETANSSTYDDVNDDAPIFNFSGLITKVADAAQQAVSVVSSLPETPIATNTPPAASSSTSTSTNKEELQCGQYGGPAEEDATNEMMYWDYSRDHETTAEEFNRSPLKHPTDVQYVTMEPDEGGFNNIRMAMETAVAIALVTGRTLVLPPKVHLYLLGEGNAPLGYGDFYQLTDILARHPELSVIEFNDFLQTIAMTGQLRNVHTGAVTYPPNNRTDYTGAFNNFEQTRYGDGKPLWEWLRSGAAQPLEWNYDKCVVGFPTERGPEGVVRMQSYLQSVVDTDRDQFQNNWQLRRQSYIDNPVPVNGTASQRLSEMLYNRQELCIYDESLQNEKVVHIIGETSTGYRLLIHWYAVLFFEDWRYDVYMKRFMRNEMKYLDIIHCAAARIIQKLRASATNTTDQQGTYDSMHIRRGDFQYKDIRDMSSSDIYSFNTAHVFREGRTVFIATDERDKTFFSTGLGEHYNLFYLSDFPNELLNINSNYYGMIDQLVAASGDAFFGAFYSTFTGYINRIRGYHSTKRQKPGYLLGHLDSYYYVPQSKLQGYRNMMLQYVPIQQAYWQQEFPIGWRDIDHPFDV